MNDSTGGHLARARNFVRRRLRPASASPQAGVTPDAVKWAYNLLLDREPAGQGEIDSELARRKNLRELRDAVLRSPEFQSKNAHLLRAPSISGREPAQVVEALVPDSEMPPLFDHMQRVWEGLGKTEPHWSVLSRDEFKQGNIQDPAAFYATGQNELREIRATLDRVDLDAADYTHCLEYGCGLGRITNWLATAFTEVHGVDISAPHLQLAGEYFREKGLDNVTLHHLTCMEDLDSLPKVDLIYTVLVLQHNPPPIIVHILRALFRALNPGGVAIFHVPTYRADYRFVLDEYLEKNKDRTHFEMHGLPQKVIFQLIAEAGGICLEARESERGRQVDKPNMATAFVVQKLPDA